jgi:hypothetical protein
MSNFAFRRARVGDLDYGKRCQAAGIVEATGLPFVMFAKREETCHLIEIAYARSVERTTVRIQKSNGVEEVYFVRPPQNGGDPALVDAAGAEASFPPDNETFLTGVSTPWDPGLIEEIRERIRKVVLVDPDKGWDREFGPSFDCLKCLGERRLVCGHCKGSGRTPKNTKECGHCQGQGKRACSECEGEGHLKVANLPTFPCGYCNVRAACMPFATLEIKGDKPTWSVTREAWEASGLRFVTPRSA